MTKNPTKNNRVNIGYVGPDGSYSYFTTQEYLSKYAHELGIDEYNLVPCADFPQIFEDVILEKSKFAFVPIENSLGGSVGQSFNLFMKNKVYIIGEAFSRIGSCLMADCALEEVRVVYSHPQALIQAGNWLHTNLPTVPLLPAISTAAAAKQAKIEKYAAAVGHYRLSERDNLRILAKDIENDMMNWTRFLIISKNDNFKVTQENCKSSILFTLPDTHGALARVLGVLDEAGINMRKIESRPLVHITTAWNYVFFVDVECNFSEERHAKTIAKLKQVCNSFNLLGCYNVGYEIAEHSK